MPPDLSVVIPSVNGIEILLECLAALQRCSTETPIELIVVDRCGDDVRRAVGDRLPGVRVFAVATDTPIPEMRAIGIEHASGTAIAVIEDHILVEPDWVQKIQRALGSGASVVGGSLYNAATSTIVDWAAFFCEYSHVIAPRGGPDVERLTGNNVVYRRELGVRYSAMLRAGGWEDDFHDALRQDGVALMCVPEIAVGHKMHYRMKEYCAQRYWYSRARTGNTIEHSTLSRRALGVAKSIVLPPILLTRITARVVKSDRHRGKLLQSFPLLVLFVCSWAVGEAAGYLAGPGPSLGRIR